MGAQLFSPLKIRGMSLDNRIAMSPMCQYSALEGLPTDWHRRHYAERATGGAGLVLLEATAVLPEGRISPADLGIWNDAQADALRGLVDLIHQAGAKAGVQLAHAGRKASVDLPWRGGKGLADADGGWPVFGASELPFNDTYRKPSALDCAGIARVVEAFAKAAARGLRAGFDVVEIHGAHGYLLHQFLSPLTNVRSDAWGGDRGRRFALALAVAEAVRREWPADKPLFVRLSAQDWVEGGWSLDETVELSALLAKRGVDLIDVSSGGLVASAFINPGPCYQVPFASRVRSEAGVATGAVGLITEATQAEAIVAGGQADLVFLGRLLLRDPYWPARLSPPDRRRVPIQYARAF